LEVASAIRAASEIRAATDREWVKATMLAMGPGS
jgi:hypothetical protein